MNRGGGRQWWAYSELLMCENYISLGSINPCSTERLQQGGRYGNPLEEDFKQKEKQQHKGHIGLIVSHVSCGDIFFLLLNVF